MGIFDLFGSAATREQAQLKKLARKVTEKYGPPENRQKAIDQLAELGTPAALQTLCLRFTLLADPGITDQEEKESVHGHLVDAGRDAMAPVTAFVREQESGIAWGCGPWPRWPPRPRCWTWWWPSWPASPPSTCATRRRS